MLLIERRKFTLIHRNHSEFDSTAHFDCDPKLHALHCLKCLCSLYLPLLSPTVFNNMLYCELFAVHGYRLGCVVFWFTSGRFTISSGIMHSARWNGEMKLLHFLNDTISTAAASKEKKNLNERQDNWRVSCADDDKNGQKRERGWQRMDGGNAKVMRGVLWASALGDRWMVCLCRWSCPWWADCVWGGAQQDRWC